MLARPFLAAPGADNSATPCPGADTSVLPSRYDPIAKGVGTAGQSAGRQGSGS